MLIAAVALASTAVANTPVTDPSHPKKQPTMKVIYVYDALCGWCYGFSPNIQKLHDEYGERVEFEVVSGGMVTGERIGPIGEVAPYISWAYKDVENRTGVKFGEGFLEGILKEGSAIFTSIPGGIALSIVKDQRPELALAFAGRLQKAIYYDGITPTDPSAYAKLAAEYDMDAEQFEKDMASDKYKQLAEADFARSDALGVTGFPTVFVDDGKQQHVIARGYLDYDLLKSALEQQLK